LGYRKGLVAGIIRGRPDTTQFEAFDPLQKVERSGVERLLVVPNGEAFVLLSDKTASRGFFLVYSQLPGFRAKKTFQAKRSTTQVGLEVCRRGDIVWVLHGREQVFRGELGQNRWTRVHAFGTSWGEVELACTRRSVMVVGTRREGTKGPFLHYAECDGRGCRVPRVLTRRSVRGFGARVDPMERFEVFTYGLDDLGARLRWDDGRWHAQPVLAPTERVAFEIMALDIDGAPFRMKRTFISAE
ncbi:MAG: hypothetical protein KC609_04495, partial [Myxococcales bacterium]|nr:hypothetical protein [Myxococcales bacterium]